MIDSLDSRWYYVFNRFEAGVRYQNMHKDGESSGFIGIRIGYNFSLDNAK